MASEADLRTALMVKDDEAKRLKKEAKKAPKYVGNIGRTLIAITTGAAIGSAKGIADEKAPTIPAAPIAASGLAIGGLVTCALVDNPDVAAISNEVANASLAVGAYALAQVGVKAAAEATAKMKAETKPDSAKK